jgi:spore coat protein JB
MSKEQHQLLKHISQVSFALTDTTLFLDTHPCDQNALDYYQLVRKERQEALREYTMKYGPLLVDQVECGSEWAWTDSPWPWEC